MAEQLWTTEQVAQYLGVTAETVHAYRRQGLPHAVLPGGRAIRYFRSEVDGWLNSMRVGERIALEAVSR